MACVKFKIWVQCQLFIITGKVVTWIGITSAKYVERSIVK